MCIYVCFLPQDALHVEWKMDSEFIMQIHSKKKRNKVNTHLLHHAALCWKLSLLIFSWLILAQLSLFQPWKALNKASGGTLTPAIAWSEVSMLLICTVGWWGICLSFWQSLFAVAGVCSLGRRGICWVFVSRRSGSLQPSVLFLCADLDDPVWQWDSRLFPGDLSVTFLKLKSIVCNSTERSDL